MISRTHRLCVMVVVWSTACSDGKDLLGNIPDNQVWIRPVGGEVCVDEDGDGYGPNCELGPDCDDGSDLFVDECDRCLAEHMTGCACVTGRDADEDFYTGPPGTAGEGECRPGIRSCVDDRWNVAVRDRTPNAGEICGNDLDDNCDGEIDENLFECDNCDPSCHTGRGGEGIWEDDAQDLDPTDEGGLTLHEEVFTFSYAWIANDGEGTVSKINTATATEEARYYVGIEGVINRPSRTAVDRDGDVYVANRAFEEQGSVTKIADREEGCSDANLNLQIDTSAGPDDVLAYGQDECVLWTAPVGGLDAIPRAIAIDAGDADAPNGYPWVGTFHDREPLTDSTRHGRAYKLDPEDGAVLQSLELPVSPYGAIVDSAGRLWLTAWGDRALVSVDTLTNTVAPAIVKDEPFGCDQTYGIAVDANGRIWTGGWTCECAYRFDPADASWTTIDLRGRGTTRGLGPDSVGNMWITHYTDPGALTRVPIDAGGPVVPKEDTEYVELEGTSGSVGVGADFLGNLWIVNRDSSTATRYNVASGDEAEVPTGLSPYTYSDFTGFQLTTQLDTEGEYVQDFQGCDPGEDELHPRETTWGELTWDADVPASTSLEFIVRTAATEEGLADAPEVVVATVPPDVAPVLMGEALQNAGVEPQRYLRLTVRFVSEDGVSRPVLRSFQLMWLCEEAPV